MDTINFSFWNEKSSKYVVTYKGIPYNGYFAACACVNRAIDEGIPLLNAEFMKSITVDNVKEIFKSDSGSPIPLVEERVKVISEAGRILEEKFNGTFYSCIENCNRSAVELLKIVTNNFESYRDYAEYKGQKVSFLKRAQILVADIYNSCKEKIRLADFSDIGQLTMFADYRVPQSLCFLGALEYSPVLKKILCEGTLDNGSEIEVELRGFSIFVCDEVTAMIRYLRTPADANLQVINAIDVDVFLWFYRRKYACEVEEKIPYHKTRCIYY
ncbi:hypothetical protein AB6A40_009004 [Gnathostoma spinigerum]|uniref:Queuosine 5'-phosphate N-glycosylase/hydrolase n=1 Tax=Gnathostoma spinigerum TaxID=75299 RepID=A0ABD6EQP8_9BILA